MDNLQELKELLGKPRKIVITMHYRPDADALGSSLGLAQFLRKLKHEVTVICPSPYPSFLDWMKGSKDVLIYSDQNASKVAKITEEAALIFCLDFSALYRLKGMQSHVENSKAKKLVIDHHMDPEDFGSWRYWDTTASSTAEMIFNLISKLEGLALLDKDIANCLYAGIMTDTGSFQHSNTTQECHLTTAALIKAGADVNKVSRLIYHNSSINRLKFIGYAISNRLTILEKEKTAYFSIPMKDYQSFQLQTGDTEGLVNYGLSLKGITVAALISEQKGEVRISLRSANDCPVNELAKKYFQGGGHKNASGGTSKASLEETVSTFENAIRAFRKKQRDNF